MGGGGSSNSGDEELLEQQRSILSIQLDDYARQFQFVEDQRLVLEQEQEQRAAELLNQFSLFREQQDNQFSNQQTRSNDLINRFTSQNQDLQNLVDTQGQQRQSFLGTRLDQFNELNSGIISNNTNSTNSLNSGLNSIYGELGISNVNDFSSPATGGLISQNQNSSQSFRDRELLLNNRAQASNLNTNRQRDYDVKRTSLNEQDRRTQRSGILSGRRQQGKTLLSRQRN